MVRGGDRVTAASESNEQCCVGDDVAARVLEEFHRGFSLSRHESGERPGPSTPCCPNFGRLLIELELLALLLLLVWVGAAGAVVAGDGWGRTLGAAAGVCESRDTAAGVLLAAELTVGRATAVLRWDAAAT
jgi:hypothetical protein